MKSAVLRRALAILLLATLPWAAAAQPVRVASKIDTEGALLGQLILQTLQGAGIPVQDRLQLGSTQIVRRALLAGEVDLYPEYTGNGAFFHGEEKNPVWKSLQGGFERIKSLDQKHRLVWLAPAPANNTWAIAVRKDLAAQHQLTSLHDLARWLGSSNSGSSFKLAASAEFVERPDALPAFQAAYGFKLRQDQILTLAGGDTAVTIKAAAQRTSGVNAAMAYGTDGPLAALGLVVLADPLAVQPVYAPAPVVRAEVLARHSKMAELLAAMFATLDTPTLQTLNARIALEGQDARQVAAAHLRANRLTGLLK
ncbi:MAG: ABC transporter substrate-binding protein [Burkholderiaceae bacterium]|jgi:osmoprotectant transport system substrate-binding protein|nr:ABC transporter substrate-binding protein [Burkholderiaceae bacterium]